MVKGSPFFMDARFRPEPTAEDGGERGGGRKKRGGGGTRCCCSPTLCDLIKLSGRSSSIIAPRRGSSLGGGMDVCVIGEGIRFFMYRICNSVLQNALQTAPCLQREADAIFITKSAPPLPPGRIEQRSEDHFIETPCLYQLRRRPRPFSSWLHQLRTQLGVAFCLCDSSALTVDYAY